MLLQKKSLGSHFVLSQINTLHCWQKELEQGEDKGSTMMLAM